MGAPDSKRGVDERRGDIWVHTSWASSGQAWCYFGCKAELGLNILQVLIILSFLSLLGEEKAQLIYSFSDFLLSWMSFWIYLRSLWFFSNLNKFLTEFEVSMIFYWSECVPDLIWGLYDFLVIWMSSWLYLKSLWFLLIWMSFWLYLRSLWFFINLDEFLTLFEVSMIFRLFIDLNDFLTLFEVSMIFWLFMFFFEVILFPDIPTCFLQEVHIPSTKMPKFQVSSVGNLGCAIGAPAKTRYSGHLLAPFCAHWSLLHLSAYFSLDMKEGWKMKRKWKSIQKEDARAK